MGELTLYKDCDDGNTIISNCFIDHYLADANDAQIKVYLFLLRSLGSSQATSICAIAYRKGYPARARVLGAEGSSFP